MTAWTCRWEVELGIGVTLLGGQTEPAHSFGLVLENALALGVPETEKVLGAGEALLGGLAIPLYGLGIVLWHALAEVVPETEIAF